MKQRRSRSYQQHSGTFRQEPSLQYSSNDINEVHQLDQWKTLNSAYRNQSTSCIPPGKEYEQTQRDSEEKVRKQANEIKSVHNEQNYYLYQMKNNSRLLNSILASKFRMNRTKSYNLMNRSGKSVSEKASISVENTNNLLNSFSGFQVFNQIPLSQVIKVEEVYQAIRNQDDSQSMSKSKRQRQMNSISKSQNAQQREIWERIEKLKSEVMQLDSEMKSLSKRQKKIQDEIVASKQNTIHIHSQMSSSVQKYYKRQQEIKQVDEQRRINIKNIVNKLINEENYNERQRELSEQKLKEEINIQDQKQLLDELSLQYKDTLQQRVTLFRDLEQEYVQLIKLFKNEQLPESLSNKLFSPHRQAHVQVKHPPTRQSLPQ